MGAHRKERKVRKEFLLLSFAFFARFAVFYIAHLFDKNQKGLFNNNLNSTFALDNSISIY
jgi:hypothetical protein